MSEEHNADEMEEMNKATSEVNRRRFVKSLGVAGGAGVFGAYGMGRASAESTSGGVNTDVRMMGDKESLKYVEAARSEEDYELLKEHFADEYSQKPVVDTVQVVEAKPTDGSHKRIVSFDTRATDAEAEREDIAGNVIVVFEDGSTTAAGALQYLNDGIPEQAVDFHVTDGSVKEEVSEAPGSLNDLATEGTGDVTVQASIDCNACKILFESICTIGCTIGAKALCVAAFGALGVVGGGGCILVAGSICTYINKHPGACKEPSKRNCRALNHC